MPAAGTARKSQRVPAPAPYPQPSRSRGKAKKDTVTAPAPARRSPKGKSVAVLAPLAPYRMAILEQKFDQLTGLVSNIALINGQNRTIITQRSNGESDRDLSPSSDKVTVPGNTFGTSIQEVTSKSVLDGLGPKPDIVGVPVPLPLPLPLQLPRAVSYRDL
ncbi:hypothetical protein RvY_11649-3 [Ramazzottius varieornatus]|uniref:Uncharacterized protein n=1 Tax=Ramazzottius varieornatus TaxID=947166 RepID=A0A1D1VQM3_RAMVA|nr:hypothetical protein RvY_11649-3 [Ramazzottius varieornatus]